MNSLQSVILTLSLSYALIGALLLIVLVYARLHWSAKVAGRLWRSTGSRASSQRARSTRLASPVPSSASSAWRGRAAGAGPRTTWDGLSMMNVIIAANFLRAPKKLAFNQPKVAGIALGAISLVLATAFGLGWAARGTNGAAQAEIGRMQGVICREVLR